MVFALNQDPNLNILSGGNNLIRMVADTQPDESGGLFAFQQSSGASYGDNTYPLNTLVTVHFVLNNTADPATNVDGVTVAANSAQIWKEIDGNQSFAGSANLLSDRLDPNQTPSDKGIRRGSAGLG